MALTTPIVQGFLRTLLNENEAEEVMVYAQRLKRYLIPSEASWLLKREIKMTLQENQIEQMGHCWIDFCKSNNYDQSQSITDLDVLEAWFKWVTGNFKVEEKQLANSWTD